LTGSAEKAACLEPGAGYDHTLFNTLVIGAFVDYDISDIDTTLSISIPPLAGANARANFNIENQLSIGGRLGYLVSPTTLFFTTFGYARVETSDVKASLNADLGSISGTLASVRKLQWLFRWRRRRNDDLRRFQRQGRVSLYVIGIRERDVAPGIWHQRLCDGVDQTANPNRSSVTQLSLRPRPVRTG
jgi:hypothetical protein